MAVPLAERIRNIADELSLTVLRLDPPEPGKSDLRRLRSQLYGIARDLELGRRPDPLSLTSCVGNGSDPDHGSGPQ